MVYDQKGVPGIGQVPLLAISRVGIVQILDEIWRFLVQELKNKQLPNINFEVF